MGHSICGIILKGGFNQNLAESYDLQGINLGFELTLFHIDIYYTACWQKKLNILDSLSGPRPKNLLFPNEGVIAVLMSIISGVPEPTFALIVTEYFGGIGSQWALVYRGSNLVNPSITQISLALRYLGVLAKNELDEFDTVGLSQYRSQPEYLNKYVDLAEELGV